MTIDHKKTVIRVDNRIVGTVVGNLFIKRINGSRHLLRYPPSIAFDKQSLRQAVEAGAIDVMVIDKETGVAYCSSLLNVYSRGVEIERGFGTQIALQLKYWEEVKPTATEEQAPLFDERKENDI